MRRYNSPSVLRGPARGARVGGARLRALAAAAALGALAAACGASSPMPAGYAGDDARAFVVKHRPELEAEIAAGSGPRIYDLAIIANCQDVPALGRRLHRHYDDFFQPSGEAGGAGGDAEIADRIVRFMSERRELRCLGLDLSRTRDMAAGTRHIGPRRGPTTARGGTR